MEKKLMVIPPNQMNKSGKERDLKKLRVAAYCRVSTEQEEQLGSLINQVVYYREYIGEKEEYQLVEIFSDEGISGTGTRKRTGFRRMILACEEGKIDLVITKSISRFARNTRDCLYYARHLKSLGIPVIFEKECINTMESSGELLFTILSSLAQEESRNISENTRWGIRSRFQQGIPHINTECFLGYDKDEKGGLVINPDQAQTVRRIFREFLEGWQPSEIARRLKQEKIPGVHGEPRWAAVSILRMLRNEAYKGDLLMQKYYVQDFLTGEIRSNDGRLAQYYVENNHKAIIKRRTWDAVQLELKRLEKLREFRHIRELGSCTMEPYYGKLFCACCGGKITKKSGKSIWKCKNTGKNGNMCFSQPVEEEHITAAIGDAWRKLVQQRENLLTEWENAIEHGDALESIRAEQLQELTGKYAQWEDVKHLTRMLIRGILIDGSGNLRIKFMDDTCLQSADFQAGNSVIQ